MQEVAGDMSVTYDRYSQATAGTITKDQDLWLLQTIWKRVPWFKKNI